MQPEMSPEFESLLKDLFVKATDMAGDRVDTEIRGIQRRVAELLDLDRFTLWQVPRHSPRALYLTHVYEAAIEPHPQDLPAFDPADGSAGDALARVFPTVNHPFPKGGNASEFFPWVAGQILAGTTVVIHSVDDLPPEAGLDAAGFRLVGTRAVVAVPLRAESGVIGSVSFVSTRGPRTWPPVLITQFELVAQVFALALSQKQANEALREDAARLDTAAAAASVGLWELDFTTGLITATAVAREIHGFGPDVDVALDRVLETIHPDDRQQVLAIVTRPPVHGTDVAAEYRVRRTDGAVAWMHSRGRVSVDRPPSASARLFGASRDITHFKEAEQRLRDALDESARLREQLKQENVYLHEEIATFTGSPAIVGRSPAIRRALAQAEQVASTTSTVLLLGETGTGKGRFATAIHQLSPRRARPMVQVNCSAIPQTLIESELFGREKGAYTGALTRQIGRFELAHGSTIFLDEIGELPLEIQVKLLKVIEEKRIERLGSPHSVTVDVRIIAATNRNLDEAQRTGAFRRDLFYRLNVFPITVPPLRDRQEDIPLLVRALVEELAAAMGKRVDAIPRAQMNALMAYRWPGNIRELRNTVERALIAATGPTLAISLPSAQEESASADGQTLEDVERAHIVAVLNQTGWRIRGEHGAARVLALPPTTLENRMKKLGITRPGSSQNSPAT